MSAAAVVVIPRPSGPLARFILSSLWLWLTEPTRRPGRQADLQCRGPEPAAACGVTWALSAPLGADRDKRVAPADIIETNAPARLDRLPWSRFHWLVIGG